MYVKFIKNVCKIYLKSIQILKMYVKYIKMFVKYI